MCSVLGRARWWQYALLLEFGFETTAASRIATVQECDLQKILSYLELSVQCSIVFHGQLLRLLAALFLRFTKFACNSNTKFLGLDAAIAWQFGTSIAVWLSHWLQKLLCLCTNVKLAGLLFAWPLDIEITRIWCLRGLSWFSIKPCSSKMCKFQEEILLLRQCDWLASRPYNFYCCVLFAFAVVAGCFSLRRNLCETPV